jgi:Na+/glutamate symporter
MRSNQPENVSEIDVDKLNERIHEEVEREGGALLKTIALTTALCAALGAVAALLAGGTVNEALVLKTEATQLQAEASDQWAAYQAKAIKSAIQQASQLFWTASGKNPPPRFSQEQQRYTREQAELERLARNKVHQRDRKSAEADELLHEHHRFAHSVALFQVAIALGAVEALTRMRLVWFCSMLVGLIGAGLFITIL